MQLIIFLYIIFELFSKTRLSQKKVMVSNTDKSNTQKIEGSGASLIAEISSNLNSSIVNVFTLNSEWYILSYNQDYITSSNDEIIDVDENIILEDHEINSNFLTSFYISKPIMTIFVISRI